MNDSLKSANAGVSGRDYADRSAEREDGLAHAQLTDGAREISGAATDAIGNVREAIAGSFADIAQTLRAVVREHPFTAIATAAGVAYVYARIRH